jgi:hypothetical protein
MVPHWIVRRLDGDSWSTIDDLPALDASGTREATAAYEDGEGVTYVVGRIADAGGPTAAMVRRSVDTTTWTDIDTFVYAPGLSTGAGSLTADSEGNLYVLYRGVAEDMSSHWIVRRLACK